MGVEFNNRCHPSIRVEISDFAGTSQKLQYSTEVASATSQFLFDRKVRSLLKRY
ncbi:MAG: hypothetical protein QNJ60_09255 [Xenococcaceae cyanobacterium MO_188.B19]|nr:hypothetical protein [Xenococcaceae cyanobacterium MO_188.B19]